MRPIRLRGGSAVTMTLEFAHGWHLFLEEESHSMCIYSPSFYRFGFVGLGVKAVVVDCGAASSLAFSPFGCLTCLVYRHGT
jgi:hypothetical protein